MIYENSCFVSTAEWAVSVEIVRDIGAFAVSCEGRARIVREMGLSTKGALVVDRIEDDLTVYFYVGDRSGHALGGELYSFVNSYFSGGVLTEAAFSLTGEVDDALMEDLAIGWGLGAYRYELFKSEMSPAPSLLLVKDEALLSRVDARVCGLCLVKDLINEPPNSLYPEKMMAYAQEVADKFDAAIKVYQPEEVCEEFPLVYGVGQASENLPYLADIVWGDDTNPMVTLVGKGVTFDTGGLDVKPVVPMKLMKKDMGGAAHVLGLGYMIMALNLPIRLRVIVPSAENSIGGNAMRPSDVLYSRIGKTVEIGNTDAEGRLLLADGLTLATENEVPDLLVDMGTLTGGHSMGVEISAMMSNNDEVAQRLQEIGFSIDDRVWQLPLWDGYLKELKSSVADINNDGSGRAGAIHVGLFLQEFLAQDVDWLHLDIFGWEMAGKPARPQGGADYGIRALLAYIEERFC